MASAIKDRRWPGLRQIIGTLISVASVVGVTSLLLAPSSFGTVVLPSVSTVVMTVCVATPAALVVARQTGGTPPLVRSGSLAVTAAAMFGLTSVLVHTVGTVLHAGARVADQPLLLAALLGMAVMLPTGVWAMQTAYISGSPQVVICCLTLIDPLTAVIGGRLLLHDGVPITSATLLAAIGCALLGTVGVVLLSRKDPVQPGHGHHHVSSHDPMLMAASREAHS